MNETCRLLASSDKTSSVFTHEDSRLNKKSTAKCEPDLVNTENMAEHATLPEEEQLQSVKAHSSDNVKEESSHVGEEDALWDFNSPKAGNVPRPKRHTQPHPSTHIKEEPDSWEDGHLKDTNMYIQYSSTIKDEPVLCCEGNFIDLNTSIAADTCYQSAYIKKETVSCNGGTILDPELSDHTDQYPSTDVKEEPPYWEEGKLSNTGDTEQYPSNVKEKTTLGVGENLSDHLTCSPDLTLEYSPTHIKEESVLCDGSSLMENEIYAFTYTGENMEDTVFTKNSPQLVQGSKYIKFTSPSPQPAKTGYTCPVCQRSFKNHGNLVKHREAHNGKKPTCSICWEQFLSQSDLMRHQIQSHNVDKSTKVRKSNCLKCGAKFSLKSDLLEHRKVHKIEKRLYCSQCNKQFSCNSQLVIHQRIHTGEKPFTCSECGKQFSNKSDHAEHIRIHMGSKPFSCSDCGKCFHRKDDLTSHQQKHGGDKTLTCSDCRKCFVNENKLLIHQRFHDLKKHFSCSICGKSFTNNDVLLRHQRCHADKNPYICGDCGKSFIQHEELVKHQRIHT
ncbi:zinc finger protein 883-like isoform X2 [Hyla sarda]|uniref:zinc finger protein 883-like isoform X2 n=1 Tax=Hyla sarda TaxID=327740 RepID=UPI0024C2EF98|nr:zinc finger protein 883-like isoform X2 [Hyla sarda]